MGRPIWYSSARRELGCGMRDYVQVEVPPRPWAKIITGVLVTVLGTGAGLWYLFYGQSDLPGPLAGDDVRLLSFLRENQATEARQWLNAYDGRQMAGMTREQAFRHIDHLYELGAQRVLAYGGQVSVSLVIQMPDDPQRRKELFAWHRQNNTGIVAPPAVDVGQRYLLVGAGI